MFRISRHATTKIIKLPHESQNIRLWNTYTVHAVSSLWHKLYAGITICGIQYR